MEEKILYTPWRIEYILSNKEKSCIFCFDEIDDDKHFVVYRSKHCYVILNMFPYNNGHIMIIPNKHISKLSELDSLEILDLFDTVKLSENILQKAYKPEGFNIGINIGKVAGAGIADHLHVHLVPRWGGDTNFMSSCGGFRLIPENLHDTFNKLKSIFIIN